MLAAQQISTLVDGELNVDEAGREIERLKTITALREHWDTYHLIGDAMRGSAMRSPGFSERFSAQLAQEATVLAPQKRVTWRATHKIQTYALSAAASLAAIAAVGWVVTSTPTTGAPEQRLVVAPPAQLQPPLVVVKSAGTIAKPDALATSVEVVPEEQMQDYMLAHQGISPTTAIQGVAPYIRTVSSNGE